MKRYIALICALLIMTVLSSAAFPIEKSAEGLYGIMICSCPQKGELVLEGKNLGFGSVVLAEKLESIEYIAKSREDDSFSYIEVYNSLESGGTVECALRGDHNTSPCAYPSSAETMRGLTTCGILRASDPDGDELEYKILSMPDKGRLEINGGEFVYTPYSGRYGDDSFTYIVRDGYGSWSGEAKVSIEISKKDPVIVYADMEGEPSQYAAVRLAQKKIYTGPSIGGICCFKPEEKLTRAEFAAMALSAADVEPAACASTAFNDNESIPAWSRGYVAAGANNGMIVGSIDESGQVSFGANDEVTVSAAAAMLERLFGTAPQTDDTVSAAAAVHDGRGILGAMAERAPDDALTRADAALLLCRAMDRLEARGGLGLFSWTSA